MLIIFALSYLLKYVYMLRISDTCPASQFSCTSGTPFCVALSNVCDGSSDCQDGSDEALAAGCGMHTILTRLNALTLRPH